MAASKNRSRYGQGAAVQPLQLEGVSTCQYLCSTQLKLHLMLWPQLIPDCAALLLGASRATLSWIELLHMQMIRYVCQPLVCSVEECILCAQLRLAQLRLAQLSL